MKIALVGRPNVGKSALFNRICRKRLAIVDEAEGVTRDRLYAETEFFGKPFTVIDTGGLSPFVKIPFQEEVCLQTAVAMEEADIIVLVVDGLVGVTALDEYVASRLMRTKKRVVLAVNKIDDLSHMHAIHHFHSLGITEMVAVSAAQGFQIAELLERCFEGMTFEEETIESTEMKIAILGRPNVGKSTLVNKLIDQERCVVSPIAGTTRDSIDVSLTYEGKSFLLIDTAGIRRKKAEHDVVDKFAALRTKRALERADVCVLMIDATQGMTTQEKRIAEQIEQAGKGCVIVANKWDIVEGFRMEHCLKGLHQEVSFLRHCPILFVSAKTGRNVETIIETAYAVYLESKKRISTGQLNTFIEKVLQRYHPPMLQGKRLRIYYMTQVQTTPVRFVLFVNVPGLMLDSYKQYLMNQFREHYGFLGVPLVFDIRGKNEERKKTITQIEEPHNEKAHSEEECPDLQQVLDVSYYGEILQE